MRAPASAAALELGLLAKKLGRSDATAILQTVANTAPELILAGRALHALGAFDDANNVFRNAVAKAPKDPEANTAWGELYLDAHQKADALELFSEALEGDQKWTPAILGAAQALLLADRLHGCAAFVAAVVGKPCYVICRHPVAQDASGNMSPKAGTRTCSARTIPVQFCPPAQ